MKRQQKFAIAGITGAMLLGAGTGAVLNLPSSAGASGATPIATISASPETCHDDMRGPEIDGPGMGHEGPGRPGMGHGGRGVRIGIDAAATTLGITNDELRTELESGKTIAEVASDKGVNVQTVIDAMVAAETAHITERVTDAVNGVRPTPPDEAPNGAPNEAPDTTTATTTG